MYGKAFILAYKEWLEDVLKQTSAGKIHWNNQSEKWNFIAGCINRHPCIELNEFNLDHFKCLSENLSREKIKKLP